MASSARAQTAFLATRGSMNGILTPTLNSLITEFNPQASPFAGGGYCDLYLAHMTGIGKVALKKMRVLGTLEKLKKKFRYEAKIWSVLRHPYILPFLGTYELDGWTYMVSQWQPHGSLPAYLKAKPDADRFRALDQISGALLYLHACKPAYIHGDIKGQNVLVSETGDCLLCDFGLSTTVDEAESLTTVPSSVRGGGSLRYMAPELFEDDQKSMATDVFAFAMLILEVITARIPYDTARLESAVLTKIMTGNRPTRESYRPCFDIDEVKEECIWGLMEKCWKQQAVDRCTMMEANREIQKIRGSEIAIQTEAPTVTNDSTRSLTQATTPKNTAVQAVPSNVVARDFIYAERIDAKATRCLPTASDQIPRPAQDPNEIDISKELGSHQLVIDSAIQPTPHADVETPRSPAGPSSRYSRPGQGKRDPSTTYRGPPPSPTSDFSPVNMGCKIEESEDSDAETPVSPKTFNLGSRKSAPNPNDPPPAPTSEFFPAVPLGWKIEELKDQNAQFKLNGAYNQSPSRESSVDLTTPKIQTVNHVYGSPVHNTRREGSSRTYTSPCLW